MEYHLYDIENSDDGIVLTRDELSEARDLAMDAYRAVFISDSPDVTRRDLLSNLFEKINKVLNQAK